MQIWHVRKCRAVCGPPGIYIDILIHYVCVYIYMCVYMYVYIYIYIWVDRNWTIRYLFLYASSNRDPSFGEPRTGASSWRSSKRRSQSPTTCFWLPGFGPEKGLRQIWGRAKIGSTVICDIVVLVNIRGGGGGGGGSGGGCSWLCRCCCAP